MEEKDSSLFDNTFTEGQQMQLLRIGKWIRAITIIGYGLGAAIVFTMIFSGKQLIGQMVKNFPVQAPGLYGIFIFVFFIFFFVFAAMLFFLTNATNHLRGGVILKNTALIAKGFQAIKNFFLVLVLLSLIGLAGNIASVFIN